jgi:hypothetical protein
MTKRRITAAMMAAGKAAFARHSYDTGGTYEIESTAENLIRDIFKAMIAAEGIGGKNPGEKAHNSSGVAIRQPHA